MKAVRFRPCLRCCQPGREGPTGRALYDVRRQLCKRCYVWLHSRRLLPPQPTLIDLLERWRVIDDNGCWLWQGSIGTHGYGSYQGLYVHRVSYEHYVGPIPDGLQIDHLCKVTRCLNPEHLEPVTNRENIHRGDSPSILIVRTGRCAAGHEMTPENAYIRIDGHGRQCKTCNRLRQRRYRAARKAAAL